MDEQTIVDKLRENIPKPVDPIPITPPEILTDEQSSIVPDAISELSLLKLGNELGLVRPDTSTNEHLKFIYDQLASVSPDTSHEAILNTLRDYLTRLGFTFREDRFMRLYLWLKLNQERMAVDREMANVRG